MRLALRFLRGLASLALFSALIAGASLPARAAQRTALDEYVAKPDSNFSYRLVDKIQADGMTAFVLEMTSQQWLTEKEVNRPLWKHWLTIIKPAEVTGRSALLFIGGGSNERPTPPKPDGNLVKAAAAAKSIVVDLRMVPNQPLVFNGDGRNRSEDSMIAYTWDKYLRTGDEKWPARLPMTKSAVRAMDAVTGFCATEEAGKLVVDRFFVAGGSKRGWTTWTTAAVDGRVMGISPIVIDMLNLVPSFKHHYAAYGFWAPAVGDYVEAGIMDWTDTPEYQALLKIEEPFEYRDRLTMPKLIMNSAGDQFFLPDSAQFYFDQLLGPKFLRYIPNSDHSLKNTDAFTSLLAFYDAVARGKALPEFTWSSPDGSTFQVTAKTKPSAVKLWQATNPNARDFRLEALGPAYTSADLKGDQGVFTAKVEKPAKGWTAFFVELTFDNEPAPLKFTTEIKVIPDTLPHLSEVPAAKKPQGFLTGRAK